MAVSIALAASADQGVRVFWLANGNRHWGNGQAYDPNTYFAEHEIPNLPENINEMVVILLCARRQQTNGNYKLGCCIKIS